MVCHGSTTTSILLRSLLLTSQLISSSVGHSASGSDDENHEKVMGAFTEPADFSLFYQSYMPLVLKFRIPNWKLENLRLNKSLQCANDNLDSSADNLCPIAYHFEGLLTPLSQTMRFYKNVFNPPGGDFYEKNFSCDKIKPHFLHFSAQLGGLQSYLNEFRNRCPLGKNATISVKNLAGSAAQHAVIAYEAIKRMYEDDLKNGTELKFLNMANYAALQNSYVLTQYVDSVRWSNAFTSCQAYRLDVGLLSPTLLNDSLTELEKDLAGTEYTFSLPFLSSLPHYYKIPLADCIITTPTSGSPDSPVYDNKDSAKPDLNTTANLIVRVLIPLVKAGVSHRIIKLNKIPYVKRENGEDKICEIMNFQPEDAYLLEQNDTTKADIIIGRVSPFCLTSKLCKVPEVTHRQVVDPCVAGVLTKNHTLTAQYCFFECSAVTGSITNHEKVFPIFTQLSSNRYAITGLAPDTIPFLYIACNGETTHMFKPNTIEGVIFITLSCNCELSHGIKRFPVQEPCSEPIAVDHVLEFGTRKHHDDFVHDDIYDAIDYAVDTLDANEFNLTFSETDTTNPPKEEADKEQQHQPNTSSTTTEKTTSATPTPLPLSQAAPPPHTQLHCGHVLLWIFLITLFIINVITLFILYKNRLISYDLSLFHLRTTTSLSRFTNEIPITSMTTENTGL